MKAKLNLKTATDAEINAAFAEHVCKWRFRKGTPPTYGGSYIRSGWECGDGFRYHLPDFLHSVDAVLPWLEKWDWWELCQDKDIAATHDLYWCTIFRPDIGEIASHYGRSNTAPRAAVIALLRAHGVEVSE